MTTTVPASPITEIAYLADYLGSRANDTKQSDTDRKLSADARDAVVGALGKLVNGDLNRPPTVTAEELENMRPLDVAKFFDSGGVIVASK